MLKQLLSLVCVAALSCAFVGCDAGAVKDKAKSGVDSAAGAAHDAAAGAVPEAAKGAVDGGIDAAKDTAHEAIDEAAGTK